jgi:lysyl-tRNA synthetase class 2
MADEKLRLARLRSNLERRARIFELTRRFFQQQGYLEVDTPVLAPAVAPELNIIPLESEGWFLAASPELHMKRLLAAGYERIFQISHCFRRGEKGKWHNPEFSLLEWYRADAGCLDMMDDTARLVRFIAGDLGLEEKISYQGQSIDLGLPWPRLSVSSLFMEHAGWDPAVAWDAGRFDDDMALKVIPALPVGRPVIMLDYPAPAASLARFKKNDPRLAERAEVYIGGLEVANAYSELTDAGEQRQRFLEEIGAIKAQRQKEMPVPESFLEAVGRMPECGGIALGMERLSMLFCDAARIDEVMAFSAGDA